MTENGSKPEVTKRGLFLPWALVIGTMLTIVVAIGVPIVGWYSNSIVMQEQMKYQSVLLTDIKTELIHAREEIVALRERIAKLEAATERDRR